MPAQVNSNYSATFQKFVDFATKAYATTGENTVARFEGMPKGDYKGSFASFWRTSGMKTANDPARDFAFSLIVANFSKAQLQAASAALRSETTAKLFAVLDEFQNRQYPAASDVKRITRELPS